MRIAACGHTMAHLAHWMQISGSQAGISRAILRFSHCAVAVGKVPSQGIALTGRPSPNPEMIWAVTSCTNLGAWDATADGRRIWLETTPGTGTSNRLANVLSMASK